MMRAVVGAVVAAVLVLGLGACTNGAAKDTPIADATRSDGVRFEQSLARGTRVRATIQSAISSLTDKPGQILRAIVSGDVKGEHGGVVIPAGSDATLTIAQLEPGSDQLRPEGRLSLVVSSVNVNGQEYPLTADLAPVPNHLEGRAMTADEAVRHTYRDVIVSAGTPIVFTLSHTLNVSAR
jgi:hypothetical protein